ncbi:MAG TPA: hypothetical protein VJZ01_09655 [Lachnospiraceae bacterium]|nr:hypothetical protein [Lachnospiraceae bacterium]
MREKFRFSQEQIIAGVIFLITILIACSPLFTENCINGHDIEYHLLRIESLKEGILMGKPFLKVNVLFLGGAGYASSMFYSDFLLYFPALLRVCGVGINASYHLFVALCFILCYAAAFYCTKQITKSSYAGTIAAVVMTLCQYHIDDVYTRSAVGEYTAFIFIPFVIYGLYDILFENMKKPWVFALGFAGVLLCHTTSLVMCVILCFVAFLIRFKTFLRNPKLLLRVALTTLFTMLITISYWLPMLEQLVTTTFFVDTAWIMPVDAMQEVQTVLSPVFPAIGIALLLVNLPRVFIKKTEENKELRLFADLLMLAGACFAILATRIIPWERIGAYISFVQFPWRFYILASVCLATSGAIVLHLYFAEGKVREYVLLAVLGLMCVSAVNNLARTEEGYYSYSDDYFEHVPFTANIIAGEWLPETVTDTKAFMEQVNSAKDDKGEEVSFTRVKNTIEIESIPDSEYIDVPLLYYKGYGASLMNGDGSRTNLTVTDEGENGFCRVYLSDAQQGKLVVSYVGTTIQKISYVVTILTACGLIAFYLYQRRKHRRNGLEVN